MVGVINTGQFNNEEPTTLTIDAGAITVTQRRHIVAAEAGVTDNLDTINVSASVPAGYLTEVILIADTGDTITIRDGQDNIELNGGANIDLTGDKQILLADNSTNWTDVGEAGSGLFSSYAIIRDEKAQNTAGGAFTLGAWRTRDLNTEHYDADGIVTIAANQFTLQAGTYFVRALAPGYKVQQHKVKLYNATDAADIELGTSEIAAAADATATRATVTAVFTIAAAKAIELQHYSIATHANGFGVASNIAVEVYSVVEIWMV